MAKTVRIPGYLKHSSGQARCIIGGRAHYLGKFGSAESREAYARLLAEQAGAGNARASDASALTIVELCAAYLRFASDYYAKDGRPTSQVDRVKSAIRVVNELYGTSLVQDFGPLKLKAVQQRFIEQGRVRTHINSLVGVVRRIFKWAASEELAPESVYRALETVPGLRRGRTTAVEGAPVRPVDEATVEATLPFLPAVVADMVRFQRLTGCRPGEVVIIRPSDVDTGNDVWTYQPTRHKVEHYSRTRIVFIGPKAQDVLRPYLLRAAESYCFSPTESRRKQYEAMRENRKSRVQPSQVCRKRRRPKTQPSDKYSETTYARAIARACDAADRAAHEQKPKVAADVRLVERWSPNRLRHALATEARRVGGLEAAQVVLGHSRADVTQLYAQRDADKAIELVRRIG